MRGGVRPINQGGEQESAQFLKPHESEESDLAGIVDHAGEKAVEEHPDDMSDGVEQLPDPAEIGAGELEEDPFKAVEIHTKDVAGEGTQHDPGTKESTSVSQGEGTHPHSIVEKSEAAVVVTQGTGSGSSSSSMLPPSEVIPPEIPCPPPPHAEFAPTKNVTFVLPNGSKISVFKRGNIVEATCVNKGSRGSGQNQAPVLGRPLGFMVAWCRNDRQKDQPSHLRYIPPHDLRVRCREWLEQKAETCDMQKNCSGSKGLLNQANLKSHSWFPNLRFMDKSIEVRMCMLQAAFRMFDTSFAKYRCHTTI